MTARTQKNASSSVLSVAPLLITESADEFADFHAQLEQEIGSSGVIERMFVYDIAALTWEIMRLQRCKAAVINLEFLEALKLLLLQLLNEPDKMVPHQRIHFLATRWFTDKAARQEVLELLGQFGLDERAIEAEAIKGSSADLAAIDKMLSLLEGRRRQALRSIALCREELAKRLECRSDLLLDQDNLVQLEHRSEESDGN